MISGSSDFESVPLAADVAEVRPKRAAAAMTGRVPEFIR
jgi:hypothetical protein